MGDQLARRTVDLGTLVCGQDRQDALLVGDVDGDRLVHRRTGGVGELHLDAAAVGGVRDARDQAVTLEAVQPAVLRPAVALLAMIAHLRGYAAVTPAPVGADQRATVA